MDWFAKHAYRIIAIALVVIAVGAFLLVQSCQRERTAKTGEKVATGQADAATKSGQDAVNTVGKRAAQDAAGDDLTRDNANAIRKADGSDAAVNPAARNAGLTALCKRPAYRSDPRCKGAVK